MNSPLLAACNAESALTAIEPCCPSCGSTALVKSGHNSCGTQQFLCKVCGAHRVLNAKSRATEPQRKAEVLHAVKAGGLSLREAERRFGIARQTIARWRKNSGLSTPVAAGRNHFAVEGIMRMGSIYTHGG